MIAPRDPRRARLAVIKDQIASDTYDTPEKMAAALDAFLVQHGMQLECPAEQSKQLDPNEKLRRKKPK